MITETPEKREITEAHKSFYEDLEKLCGQEPGAYQWATSAYDAALVWDHLTDDDEISKPEIDKVFTSLLTEWPLNPFFMKYRTVLVPVMVNAISSWRYSNDPEVPKDKCCDWYTEIASTIAYLLGGWPLVEKYLPKMRKNAYIGMVEDEVRDKGKK